MIVEIEYYRGWTISFDTDREVFFCESIDYETNGKEKNSFSLLKKWIDNFIKDNQNFEPVYFESIPDKFTPDGNIKVIGITKHGKVVYEDKDGRSQVLSSYREGYYILRGPENDKYREEALLIDNQIKDLEEKKKKVLENISGLSLVDFKRKIMSQTK